MAIAVFASGGSDVAPPELPILVYGKVFMEDGSAANGADYVIQTFDRKTGGMISESKGTVGDEVDGYVFSSQNFVRNDLDTIIISVVKGNQTATITHKITSDERYETQYNFGILNLSTRDVIVEPELEEGELFLHSVKFIGGEYLVIEEDLITGTVLDNTGERDLEDVKVNVLIQDLGVWRKMGPFDIDADDTVSQDVWVEIPEYAEPGVYDVRITISNEDVRRVVYRQFNVVEE